MAPRVPRLTASASVLTAPATARSAPHALASDPLPEEGQFEGQPPADPAMGNVPCPAFKTVQNLTKRLPALWRDARASRN